MWVELEATTWGEYHNMPKTISPKKEIRNSKTATHKRRYEYISEHRSENGSVPDLNRKRGQVQGPSSTHRSALTPEPRTPRKIKTFKVPLTKFSGPET